MRLAKKDIPKILPNIKQSKMQKYLLSEKAPITNKAFIKGRVILYSKIAATQPRPKIGCT